MIRNLKALGIAFVAVFAMSAVAASGAQANPLLHADSYPATLTAHSTASDHVFTINKGPVKCKTHNFEATLDEASSTLTVTPHYTSCTFVGLNATVSMNGCHYLFHLVTGGPPPPPWLAVADVVCPAGKKIVVKSLQCTAEVGGQTGLGEIQVSNVANGDVAIKANVSGISYTTAGSCGASSASDGTYVGNALGEGEDEGEEPVDIFVE